MQPPPKRETLKLNLQKKQTRAFLSKATEILFGGAAGGGKSHLKRVAGISWSLEIPKLQVYLFRRVSNDLKKNHMEGPNGFINLLAGLLKQNSASINHTDLKIEFSNGACIFLCHCQHEKDLIKYQGAEIHVLLIDEITHFTESMYRFLRGRVRMVGVELPEKYKGLFPRILVSGNPGGIGHTWVKQTFIDAQPAYNLVKQNKSEGGLIRQYIPAKLHDNPALLKDDPDYEDRLSALGNPALVKAMKDGNWDVVLGAAFEEWNKDFHVLKPFEIPSNWKAYRAHDWGYSKPYAILYFAISNGEEVQTPLGPRCFPRGSIIFFGEIYGWNGKADTGAKHTPSQISARVLEKDAAFLEQGIKVKDGPADSAIYTKADGETSIADKMEKEGVTWVPADKSPGSRVNGWGLMHEGLRNAVDHPLEMPGIFFFDTCTHCIRTIPAMPVDPNKPEDVDTKSEDHIGDTARYAVRFVEKPNLLQSMEESGLFELGPEAIFGGMNSNVH